MARHKEFDRELALNAAIGVFREHGFEGTSTGMLVDAMGIGRQSLYDTFGDKWQLYQSSLQRYSAEETMKHGRALTNGPTAVDGIRAMLDRVVEEAEHACLGVNTICEFGRSKPELTRIQDASGHVLKTRLMQAVLQSQAEGDVAGDIDAEEVAEFLVACIAGIRIAARSGADRASLKSLARQALRTLT